MTRTLQRALTLTLILLALCARAPGAFAAEAPLVDITTLDMTIVVDIPYATTKNFTGKKLYPVNRALLRKPVAESLVKVHRSLRKRSMGLKVWDAYRPLSVQKHMWSIVPDPQYVADPKAGSKHNRGAAVDVTLVDVRGRELEMPTKFDDFSPRAARTWKGATPAAARNRETLERAMAEGGFEPLTSEWWHFDYRGWKKYGVMDIPLTGGRKADAASLKELPRDTLILHEKAADFARGALAGASREGDRVALTGREGSYTSPLISFPRAVTHMVPSWNILCGEDSGWAVEIQVRGRDGALSPWLYLGSGGARSFTGKKTVEWRWAKVEIDNIVLKSPAAAFRYRVLLSGEKHRPKLARFSMAARSAPPLVDSPLDEALLKGKRSLAVPFRSQYAEREELRSRICCPTSTSMVLEFFGVNRPTEEIAARLYHRESDLYGVWWAPPQLACQHGLRGWVQLFSTWAPAQRLIARGTPLIASIAFGANELTGSPRPSSKGHIVVVTGFDSHDRILVNDPAGKTADEGVVAYDRAQFARAWLKRGGVGIVIER